MARLARCVSALLLSQAFWTVAAVDSKLVRKNGKVEVSVASNGEIEGAALLEGTERTRELLAEVEEMVKTNDPANRDKIKQIMDIVEKLFPDIEFERDQEKEQVGINLAAIATCNTDSTNQQQEIKASTEAQVGSNRGTHVSCRDEEKKKEEHKNGRCGLLDTFLDGTNTPAKKPSGRDAEVKWVEDQSNYWCPKGPKATELDEACKQAEKEHAEHKESCDRSQYTFENSFCTWRAELSSACSNVQTCYDDAVKAYNDHRSIAEDLIKKWKTEWASLKKIRCYVDVWMNDQNTKTVDASQYEKCKAEDPDTSAIDIDFGKVPAKVTCDLTPVQVHPGTPTFPQVEYAAFSTYAAEPIACLGAVVETTEPATKPATTTTQAPAARGCSCDTTHNFGLGGSYSQQSLTDGCKMIYGVNVCNANPVYGGTNDADKAVAYCKNKCENDISPASDCGGFFFQRHGNGHEICGFYKRTNMWTQAVNHGHSAGSCLCTCT